MRKAMIVLALLLLAAVPAQASTASQLRAAQHDIRVLRHQVTDLEDAVALMQITEDKRSAALLYVKQTTDCLQNAIPVGSYGNSTIGYVYGTLGFNLFQTSALDIVSDTRGLVAGSDYVWLTVTDGTCMANRPNGPKLRSLVR